MREGWRETTLGEVAQAARPSPNKPGLRYVGLEHIDSGSPLLTRWGATDDVSSATTEFRAGDVLFSKLRPYLRKVVVPHFDGRCTSEALVYRPSSELLSPQYLALLLQSEAAIAHAQASSAGSRMPRTSVRLMSSQSVLLPRLEEQRRVVDLISGLDSAISACERAGVSAHTFARQWRAALFGEVVAVAGTARAGELFNMQLGRQKSARQTVGEHVIPYIRSGNIGSEGLRLDDVHEMNFNPAEQEKYGLQEGDILLAEGGTLGVAARWESPLAGPVAFDKHVIRLRGVPGRTSSDYALQWCRWAYESGAFDAQATGVTIRALGFGRATKMPVPELPMTLQSVLVSRLEAADALARRHRTEAARLQDVRANLLTALLSGEHEIPESYDELLAG